MDTQSDDFWFDEFIREIVSNSFSPNLLAGEFLLPSLQLEIPPEGCNFMLGESEAGFVFGVDLADRVFVESRTSRKCSADMTLSFSPDMSRASNGGASGSGTSSSRYGSMEAIILIVSSHSALLLAFAISFSKLGEDRMGFVAFAFRSVFDNSSRDAESSGPRSLLAQFSELMVRQGRLAANVSEDCSG
ncbi:hypothetical protein HDU84_008809 [Entophlyctis sp. JEL0112]|nr:hypothetical protein HDU84_008809 [Entophlyctis sp. JEL0112]